MSWRPKEGRTSLGQLWHDGKLNPLKRNPLHVLRSFFWRLPNTTYPLGETSYWKSVDKYGDIEWKAPHNLWRGIFHYIGGLSVVGLYFGVENEVKEGFKHSKTRFDLITWIAGAYTSWLLLVLFFCKGCL